MHFSSDSTRILSWKFGEAAIVYFRLCAQYSIINGKIIDYERNQVILTI